MSDETRGFKLHQRCEARKDGARCVLQEDHLGLHRSGKLSWGGAPPWDDVNYNPEEEKAVADNFTFSDNSIRDARGECHCDVGGPPGVDCLACSTQRALDKAGIPWREPKKLEWRGDYLGIDRPADDASREIWFLQGGLPVHRYVVEHGAHLSGEPLSMGTWTLGAMEHAFFAGRGCETAYFLEALDRGIGATSRVERDMKAMAAELRALADRLEGSAS